MSHTQEHLKLKEEFAKLGKKFCFYCIKRFRLCFGHACYSVHFLSLDEELKGVREKNRQNETVHEKLSSDKVSKIKRLVANILILTVELVICFLRIVWFQYLYRGAFPNFH